jgi:GAF domain-containing protein
VNSELHAITAKVAEERSQLNEISRLINSSLAIEEMIGAIAEPYRKLIPYDRFAITTRDLVTGTWTTRYVIGTHVPGYEPGTEHPETNVSVSTNSTEESPDPSLYDEMKTAGLLSALVSNLVINGVVVGSISARSFDTDIYTQRHVDLGRRIADQIAGSVANAGLHAVTTEDAAERTSLAEISRLASLSLEVEEMFEAISERLKLLVPYDRFVMSTYDSRSEIWTTPFRER